MIYQAVTLTKSGTPSTAYIESNMTDDCSVIGEPDVSGVMLSAVRPLVLLFGNVCSLYIDPDSAWREDDLFKSRRSSLHRGIS